MFFPEDTSSAAKIGIAISVILIILITLLYYDSKKLKTKVNATKPPYFFTDKEGISFNPSDTITLYSRERLLLGEHAQEPKEFIDDCKKLCYYHPECIAVVTEQDEVDSDVSKCTLKAHNFLDVDPNSTTHFIRRRTYPGSTEQRKTIRNAMKDQHMRAMGVIPQQQNVPLRTNGNVQNTIQETHPSQQPPQQPPQQQPQQKRLSQLAQQTHPDNVPVITTTPYP